jgi:hypothetical protein
MWIPDRAVLEVNLSFYEAFAAQDLGAMDALWSRTQPCSCVHPGWQPIFGRDQVMASWRAVLGADSPPIRCEEPQATVVGEMAFVLCVERIAVAQLCATNLFVLEDGLWRMVHHHAGPFARRNVPEGVVPPRDNLN